MEFYQTENEQIAIIKESLNKYKRLIVGAITIALMVMIIGGYWRHHKKVKISQAAGIYQQMLYADYKQDQQTLNAKGDLLLKSYRSTPYAEFASMLLAKNAVIANDFLKAQEYLEASRGFADPIAKLRAAKIMQQRNDLDGALKLLNSQKVPAAYVSLYEEAKGDIYYAKDDKDKAKEAYLKAKSNLPENVQSQILEMKLMDLGLGENNA